MTELRDRLAQSGFESSIAEALACALPIVHHHRLALAGAWPWLERAFDEWTSQTLCVLRQQSEHGFDGSLAEAIQRVCSLAEELPDGEAFWQMYELLLSRSARQGSGTFYTPRAIANHLVAQIDDRLRGELQCADGLSQADLQILEPACGTGVFLSAAIERACGQPGDSAELRARQLLPRLIGIDLAPAALLVARLRIAVTLRKLGVNLSVDFPRPRLVCANALAGPSEVEILRRPIDVVFGNPPFSYLSRNDQSWIQSLLRGTNGEQGYFSIDGQTLGERKTWLHDDYVKFLRLSQWCIDQQGAGIVSFVTNQGWLDNATFRIMRQQLQRTFPRIEIVDLHGSLKRHEASPVSTRDENVFGISQGIALATLIRPKTGELTERPNSSVLHAELWGTRAEKLARLGEPPEVFRKRFSPIEPQKPWFNFVPDIAPVLADYATAPLLTSLMPVNSTVPVTARDYFVVARTREELSRRIAEFVDPAVSDDDIRARFFGRTRSQRYPTGDTRGWKLADARRAVRSEPDPEQFIVRCLYRPFVWRYVFWHPAMIDWPRADVSKHLLSVEPGQFPTPQLALLARRQSIAGKECNFFWVADCLPLDGVIRSDNRGSESFFPLWLIDNSKRDQARPNLAKPLSLAATPDQCLDYCYALFHSPSYRTRHAGGLAREFPRVPIPRNDWLFQELAGLGRQLIQLHLTDPQQMKIVAEYDDALTLRIDEFHVGTHGVCRKWLKEENASAHTSAYRALRGLIAQTLQLQVAVDVAIDGAGGFPQAFASTKTP